MGYSIEHICEIIEGKFISKYDDAIIHDLVYDTRRIQQPENALFFAIVTEHNDGHLYIPGAYKKGVRNFIVSKPPIGEFDANIILVNDCLTALQQIAAHHRRQFNYLVIGITGSNGKTVVKEWLYQLLQDDFKIVRSPKSYNSQIGVPLSVWQMNEQYNLGIFEAGISATGEMEKLERIILPTIGILTNIGEAHDEGFQSQRQKLEEKLKLFDAAEMIIGEHHLIAGIVKKKTFTWSKVEAATLQNVSSSVRNRQTTITAKYKDQEVLINIPFTDEASIQNAITCWCALLYLGVFPEAIQQRFLLLHTVDMRLQLKHGINNCIIINDSYNADTTSLKIALDFLQQQSSGLKRTVILSDFYETGRDDQSLYSEISKLLSSYKLHKIIGIGQKIKAVINSSDSLITYQHFNSTQDFIHHFRTSGFADEIILVKGARKFEFEKIVQLFEQKLHQTLLEINLNALEHNLKAYQDLLQPQTKIMAMVKAFSYGSGGAEIAGVLQFHNTHYLGVAYADEGVELVKAGITIPVMVMNAEESSFNAIVDNNLQPVLYSFHLLKEFERFLKDQALQSYPVHIEIETGMNRLGFAQEEIEELAKYLSTSIFKIQSVFTHLAASEDPLQDEFTMDQYNRFQQAIAIMKKYISYPFLKHIANSAAIVRHPHLQMDMVRLGIGLYGIENDSENKLDLQSVATLRSTIAQLKHVKKGESVSYNRRGIVSRDSLIATIRIGYADGYSRRFSNGAGKMLVKGIHAPVVGTVCMDMTMIDVTDIDDVKEGDDVIIFGERLPVQQVAGWVKTIPYEVMTGVSQRVKRVYFHE